MKRYFSILSMLCIFALAGITGATAQEAQKANPAADFEYDLTKDGVGVVIYKYKGKADDVVIPAVIEDFPVVAVGDQAFRKTNIVSVIFPDSVGTIGEGCFSGCTSLQKVELPKDIAEISKSMFARCTSLKIFIVPNSIKEIADGAFAYSGLESIEIPDSVMEIGDMYDDSTDGAFANCKKLKKVSIGNGVKVIDTNTFIDCDSLTTVSIGYGIEHIGDYAFANCTNLVVFDIGVTALGYQGHGYGGYGCNVFEGCSALSLKERKKIRDTGYTDGF